MADFKRKPEKPKPPAKRATASFALIEDPRCLACQSPHRREIDQYLVLGRPAAEVARHFTIIDGREYSRKVMANHKNKHLTLRDAALRRLHEKRAEEHGIDIEETAESLLTERSILEAMIQKGFEQVVNNEVQIAPSDLMNAMAKLKDAEIEFYMSKVKYVEQEAKEEFEAFVSAVKKHVPAALMNNVLSEFHLNMEQIREQKLLRIETPVDPNQ